MLQEKISKKSLINSTSVFDEGNLEVKDSLALPIHLDTLRHAYHHPKSELNSKTSFLYYNFSEVTLKILVK